MTMAVVGICGWINLIPSIAEETLMAGVINPSAINVQHPIIAG